MGQLQILKIYKSIINKFKSKININLELLGGGFIYFNIRTRAIKILLTFFNKNIYLLAKKIFLYNRKLLISLIEFKKIYYV